MCKNFTVHDLSAQCDQACMTFIPLLLPPNCCAAAQLLLLNLQVHRSIVSDPSCMHPLYVVAASAVLALVLAPGGRLPVWLSPPQGMPFPMSLRSTVIGYAVVLFFLLLMTCCCRRYCQVLLLLLVLLAPVQGWVCTAAADTGCHNLCCIAPLLICRCCCRRRWSCRWHLRF